MKGTELYKKALEINNKALERSHDVIFNMERDGMIGTIRSVHYDNEKIILSAAPYDWATMDCCENQDVLDILNTHGDLDVFTKMGDELSEVKDVYNDYLPENDDDDGFNFVTFKG